MPTLGELIQAAKRLGWRRKGAFLHGPRGKDGISYLERRGVCVDLPGMKQSDRLTRTTVESLCRRLEIPRDEFGLENDEG